MIRYVVLVSCGGENPIPRRITARVICSDTRFCILTGPICFIWCNRPITRWQTSPALDRPVENERLPDQRAGKMTARRTVTIHRSAGQKIDTRTLRTGIVTTDSDLPAWY